MAVDDTADNVVSGIVTADPAASVPTGTTLRFKSVPVTTDFRGTTATLNNWQIFEGIVLSISFTDQASHFVEGSAVLIAPGVAMCASHVFRPRLFELLAGTTDTMCQGLASHGLLLWRIRKVTEVPNTDITILGLELASAFPPENLFLQATMTTRTPKVGEELLLCGFRAGAPAFPITEGAPIETTGEVRISRGAVTKRYPQGRDSAMIPWPVIEVACPARGGMSGGPVFDSGGHLIGLVCSSVEISENEGVSYVSLLWPAMTAQFESTWLKGMLPSPASLLELDRRICPIVRPEAVRRIPHEDRTRYMTEYSEWEE
jgi:hypothetical protein